jgi:hypothetical protein
VRGTLCAFFTPLTMRTAAAGENYREIARTFYNSSTFFDIIEQFGPLDEELNSKRTYATWKATEIMKALKEGREPTPGGYGGDDAAQRARGLSDASAAAVWPASFPPAATASASIPAASSAAVPAVWCLPSGQCRGILARRAIVWCVVSGVW